MRTEHAHFAKVCLQETTGEAEFSFKELDTQALRVCVRARARMCMCERYTYPL